MLFTTQKIPQNLTNTIIAVPKSGGELGGGGGGGGRAEENAGGAPGGHEAPQQPYVRILVNDEGVHGNVPFAPESELLQATLRLMDVNFVVQKVGGDTFAGLNLPVLQVHDNFFEKAQFVDVVREYFWQGATAQHQLGVQHVLSLARELQLYTHYFMYVDDGTVFTHRNPYWFVTSPVRRTRFYLRIKQFERFLEEQRGVDSSQSALERARETLTAVQGAWRDVQAHRRDDPNAVHTLIVRCYVTEILRNVPKSHLATLVNKDFPELAALAAQADPVRGEVCAHVQFCAPKFVPAEGAAQAEKRRKEREADDAQSRAPLKTVRQQLSVAVPFLVTFLLVYRSVKV